MATKLHQRRMAVAAALGLLVVPGVMAAETIPGAFALTGAVQRVEGEMTVTATGPQSIALTLEYADVTTGKPVRDFTQELTQELHLLAVDSTLTRLVHEHVESAGADGRFSAELSFPAPGLYHIYADALPTGLGQQVLRFDVPIGNVSPVGVNQEPAPEEGPLVARSGAYEVTVDTSHLSANAESTIHVAITREGEPAEDLAPYLGVSLHAVIIRAEDLSYVHAHPVDPPGQGHDPAAGEAAAAHHHEHAAPEAGPVAPEMMLHLQPLTAGRYSMFLEFIGGSDVQTLQLPLYVSEHHHGH